MDTRKQRLLFDMVTKVTSSTTDGGGDTIGFRFRDFQRIHFDCKQ